MKSIATKIFKGMAFVGIAAIAVSCKNEEKKNENSILCPTNPYAATKAAAELIAKSYYHSFKMPIIITRGNNVYGPNQYPEKLIPRFIQQLQQNKKVTIQGDGSNVRAFLHVSDVCSALKLVLEKGETGEIYNIGSDDHHEYTVLDISKILIEFIKTFLKLVMIQIYSKLSQAQE